MPTNLEIAAKNKLIEDDLKKHLKSFEERRKYNRNKTITTHVFLILLGGLVTFSNGLSKFRIIEHPMDEIAQIISMILGVVIIGLSTYNAFFSNKRFWVVYTSTSNGLKKIKGEYEYYLAGKTDVEIELIELDQFRNRIQDILDEANNEWASIRNS